MHREIGTEDLFEGQVEANAIAKDFVKSIEVNERMPNDVMAKDKVEKKIELLQ